MNQILVDAIVLMRENDLNRHWIENPATGGEYLIVRRDDGFYINEDKVCDL
ncbi:hypothetical protein VPHD479_0101 [Vibrio phage D479]